MAEQQNLFARLTKLFSSGPTIKRRVRNFNKSDASASSAVNLFKKAHSDVYNSTLSAYGTFDRMARYSDFSEMESTPEIASALDIYAEESCAPDAFGKSLHVYSENRKIKELLETLFYDTLNIDFNLVMWVRNLCKYGDFFLFNDVDPEYGIINAYPISITEIEREEGFDANDPSAVRFRWITQGNQALDNWQVSHFRLLGNDAFLPYGSSVLESARRIWRQLILIEDAMLVYRVIRAPERRVFYIDVGNVPPEDVANYIEQAKTSLKRNQVVQKATGNVDLRYNPMAVDEDYYIPVRGGDSGTRIDTLAGGQNTSAIEDVEYIQKKLFAALKIPKAYLGYDEDIGSKATLAQEDIRFSRTIIRIQKTILAELNKMAMIHLYAHGFDNEQLLDFQLNLSNPSSIAQQQKLELINTKFSIAGSAPEGMVSKTWIRKNVMGFTRDDIERIDEEMVAEKIVAAEIENAKPPGGGDEGGGEGGDEGGDEGGGLFAGDNTLGSLLDGTADEDNQTYFEIDEISEDDDEDLDEVDLESIDYSGVKKSKHAKNVFGGKLKKNKIKREKTHMPDFASMTSVGSKTRTQDSMNRPYDEDFVLGSTFKEAKLSDFLFNDDSEYLSMERPRLDVSMQRSLNSFSRQFGKVSKSMLNEAKERESEFELDNEENDDE